MSVSGSHVEPPKRESRRERLSTLLSEPNPPLKPKPRIFGLKPQTYTPSPAWHDYEQKYPPDPPFHDLDEDARLWHVYNDEAEVFDKDLLEENGDSLDILLIFASLFSAIVTTFVVESASALSTDYSEVTANLLVETVALLRAGNNETARAAVAAAETSTEPSAWDVWANALWFTSLVLSLSTALVAVLAKQWLRHYSSGTIGTVRERAFIRQYRWMGFDTWKVQFIIGLLPLALHASLLVFLAGLVLWLYSLHVTIARVVLAFSGALALVYVVSNLLPVFKPQCPYRTQVPTLLTSVTRFLGAVILFTMVAFWKAAVIIISIFRTTELAEKFPSLSLVRHYISTILEVLIPDPKQQEREFALHTSDIPKHAGGPIRWLVAYTPSPSAKRIAFHALACCDLSAYFDESLCNAGATYLLGVKDMIDKLKLDTKLSEDELDACWKWAAATISCGLDFDNEHRERLEKVWNDGLSRLTVPNAELALLLWRALIYSTSKQLSFTVKTPKSTFELIKDDTMYSSELLRHYDPSAPPRLTRHLWECLARPDRDNPDARYLLEVKDEEKECWLAVVHEVLNNEAQYLEELEYPETHQKPISMAQYFAPQLQEKGWLDPEQWDLVCEEEEEEGLGKKTYRLKGPDEIMEEGMKLFVALEEGKTQITPSPSPDAASERKDSGSLSSVSTTNKSVRIEAGASVASIPRLKMSDTEKV